MITDNITDTKDNRQYSRRMDICYSLLLFFCVSAKIYSVRSSSYSHHAFLDRDKKYEMWWKFDETDITVKIKVKTTGWVAWGVSPKGKLEAADFVLSWIKNGEKHFHDMHGNILKPTLDVTEDYKMLSMLEENKTITVEFSRKLDLCSGEDASISTDTLRLIYAWADKDPVDKNNINSPTRRGKKSVYLLDYADRVVNQSLPVVYDKFDLTMEGYTLASKETVRRCKPFKLPAMTGKRHLIRIAPNITSGNENNVNYIILYQCKNISESDLGKDNECEVNITSECKSTPLHAWAPGGTVFNFPKLAGISLGTENDYEFMMLEVHYNNPDLRTDILDSSGFRIFYTENLRKYDSGVLAAGVMDEEESIIIPPNQTNFTSYGFCSSRCLNIDSSSNTVKPKIFGSLLHTNRHGNKIIVKLVRDSDGSETKRITQDLNYDSNTKVSRYFPKPVEIPPGHSINIECTYSSLTSETALVSGSGDNDESCLVFLYYYPKINASKCVSRSRKFDSFARDKLKWSFSNETGRFKSKFVIGKKDFKGKRVFDALKAKDTWKQYFDRRKVKDFEEAGKKDPYDRRCYYRKGRKRVRDAKDERTEHKIVKSLAIETCEKPIEVKTGASTMNETNSKSDSSSNATESYQFSIFLSFIVFYYILMI